jgi:hypothetical protein
MSDYQAFLASKRLVVPSCGRTVADGEIHASLFPFQRALVRWAVRKGRAALFAGTGLGKTRMQLEWARLTGERALVLAPLAVAQQTVREGRALSLDINYCREQADAPAEGIAVTNYERLEKFDPSAFGAVVLDESSILKSFSGTTKKALIASFRDTPYRLCCTATPAPNDVVELCNHADFLGIMPQAEMISTFFTPRGVENSHAGQYRLKSHAREAFYRWLSSWAMALNRPSDLGFSDAGYCLPPLSVEPVFVDTDFVPAGRLFTDRLQGVTERAAVRRATLAGRVAAMLDRIDADEPWVIWYGLLDEGRGIAAALGDQATLVEGSLPAEEKETRLLAFLAGEKRVLISHPQIAGFGMNLQHCARMGFIGLSDSFEQYFQCLRRCWRFGQTREVKAWIVLSEPERVVYENVLAKEREASAMAEQLLQHVAGLEREEIEGIAQAENYRPEEPLRLPAWITKGDKAWKSSSSSAARTGRSTMATAPKS